MTNLYGLIGKKLSHSFSPAYFRQKFKKLGLDADYRLFEMETIHQLPELLKKHPNLSGLNITIPFKTEVLPFLDELDVVAKQIATVNTVQIQRKNGQLTLKGYNTDVTGFEQTLLPYVEGRSGIKAIILGTGGAARAVAFVLKKMEIEFIFVSRHPVNPQQINYSEINKAVLDTYHLIIQTTPIGMFPHATAAPPLPYQFIGPKHILIDLIYNPAETEFLRQGRISGAATSNGQKMLTIQAEASWELWNTSNDVHFK
jgi:shikimate dehydrogenase